jgi:methyltransferase (TIGR00027 family)
LAKPAAKTGIGPTALVAIEQLFPKNRRIIEDDLAYQILPFGMRAFVWLMRPDFIRDWMIRTTEKSLPGIWGGMMCRKRYIDETLTECIGQIDGLMNLGAGFDTRAYRLPGLSGVPVWEVDQRENIRLKQRRLRKVFGSIPSHARLVSVDFDRGELDKILASHGYSGKMKTFFIWEGVTQYLTETGIRSTFDFLAQAALGSHLAFTYIRKDFLDGRNMYGWQKGYKKFVAKDKFWLFGMDPEAWPAFLKEYDWQVVEDIGAEELAERYIKPSGRALPSIPIERIAHATKV